MGVHLVISGKAFCKCDPIPEEDGSAIPTTANANRETSCVTCRDNFYQHNRFKLGQVQGCPCPFHDE